MQSQHKLYLGDCVEQIEERGLKADCVFADPPDNIKLGYSEYDDNLTDKQYVSWFDSLLQTLVDVAPTIWLSFNAKWTIPFGSVIESLLNDHGGEWECKPCVQVFTFGQHNNHDLGNNHRPLWRLKHKDAPIYPEQIRVPSWRQRNGDKRASSKGRVPGDVFDMQYPVFGGCYKITILQGDEEVEEFVTDGEVHNGDVFDFPRVTGNSKQRCDWHPTQLHEELVERCINLSTLQCQTVLDPFGGTGTTMRACRNLNRNSILTELDPLYCSKIAEANDLTGSNGCWES
jgi:DNA modification methylase